MKFKAIFVDAGGVLIINKAKEVGERYEKEFGLTKEISRDIFHFLHLKHRNEEELVEYLRIKRVEPMVWKRFTEDFYKSEGRNDELYEQLKEFRAQGVKIILTTNSGRGAIDVLKKHGASDILDGVVTSAEVGFVKPQPEFWQTGYGEAQKLVPEILPKEILVIDDSLENCKSAKLFGFGVIKYGGGKVHLIVS